MCFDFIKNDADLCSTNPGQHPLLKLLTDFVFKLLYLNVLG